MSAISKTDGRAGHSGRHEADARVVRTRSAVLAAARTLFLRDGFAGTTMDDIAASAGIAKRTLYNNYPDKDALFSMIVGDVIEYSEAFARALRTEFDGPVTAQNLRAFLDDLGTRLALAIVRPEVIALRRLLIAESRTFPGLAPQYFDRVPGQMLKTLASGFAKLKRVGLHVPSSRRAAAQFAYLVAGEMIDRAMVTGKIPSTSQVTACARDGVQTFWARYSPGP